MKKYFKSMLPLLFFCLSAVTVTGAEEFSLCPNGFFVEEVFGFQFKSVGSWSSDYALSGGGEAKPVAVFSGPIFSPYSLPKAGTAKIDMATKTVTASQNCAKASAEVTKSFRLVNGGILSTVNVKGADLTAKGPMRFRIMFPSVVNAGKKLGLNGKDILLPLEKGERYILGQGGNGDEFRLALNENLELGIKLIGGVASYKLADCRHHTPQEKQFHLYAELKGESFSYFLCLLKPGEAFPSPEPAAAGSAPEETGLTGNLLGQGSGFEVGPKNFIPFAFYSWSEAWASPATHQPVFDAEEKHEGGYSIRLTADDMAKVNGRFNRNAVIFNPVKLDPKKKYTISAWMKSDTAGLKACLDCRESIWDGAAGKTVEVSREWRRFAYSFVPSEYKLLNYCTPWVSIHPAVEKGTLWIDEVQLEEGEAGVYRTEPLEFSAGLDYKYKLFTPAEAEGVVFTARLRNNSDAAESRTIKYEIKDYWDKVLARAEVQMAVAARANAAYKISLPALPVGYYRATFGSDDGSLRDEAIFGIYEPVKNTGLVSRDWPLGCDASEGNPLVRKLGFGWTRAWDFTFKRICPEPDRLNFEETDIVVERCRKANLNLMPILGTCFGEHPDYNSCAVPDWAVKETRASSIRNSWAKEVRFPTIAGWKKYVGAVVSRYRDSIKVWEILNEPNCWITADEYAPYLKAAYEAAKAADPDCLIVGGCATSDWSGDPAPWTRRLLELDRCRSLDILSIHMYSNISPEKYYDKGSDWFLATLQAEIRKYGRELPVWHTEKSYNTTATGYSQAKHGTPGVYMKEPMFRVANFRAKAEYLLRECLIDSTVGKGPFFWFGNMPNDIHINSHRKPFGLQHIQFDNSPCPELLAANGLARLLEGRSRPGELLRLGQNKFCALFSGERGVLAALWDAEGESSLTPGTEAADCEVYNFFGVKSQPAAGGALRLGTTPIYLTFSGKDEEEVKKLILDSETGGKKFSFSGGVELQGDPVLAVYAQNLMPRRERVALKISRLPAGWAVGKETASGDCGAFEQTRLSFALTALKGSGEFQYLEVESGADRFAVSVPPFATEAGLRELLSTEAQASAVEIAGKKITIDGELSEWEGKPFSWAATSSKVKRGRKEWNGAADLSCALSFGWDAEFLYLAAVVYDDVLERGEPAKSSYGSDSIELFLGLGPESGSENPEQAAKPLGDNDFQLLLAPGMPGGEQASATAWCVQTKSNAGIRVASLPGSTGYRIEAAVPWKGLRKNFVPARGMRLGMTYQANDTDRKGGAAAKTIFWNGDGANWRNRSLWGTLELN